MIIGVKCGAYFFWGVRQIPLAERVYLVYGNAIAVYGCRCLRCENVSGMPYRGYCRFFRGKPFNTGLVMPVNRSKTEILNTLQFQVAVIPGRNTVLFELKEVLDQAVL